MRLAIVFASVLVAMSFLPASATIINVPDDYPTIQQGIDASLDGDTVLVQPGTYIENINFSARNIVVGSLFLTTGDASYISSTIIDGNSWGSVVIFEYGEDSRAVIAGFTIQNGFSYNGGGIYCSYSSPGIRSNSIRDNVASNEGGGIYCHYSDSHISGNFIFGNQVFPQYSSGGGIHCRNSNVLISDNVISQNSTTHIGGGIYCEGEELTITSNVISGNIALSGGGGIYCTADAAMITYNVIHGNTSEYMGGGIISAFGDPAIINNTVTQNLAVEGGGIYCYESNPVILNCICWADSASGQVSEIFLDGGSQPDVTYCDVQGGWDGEGNIDCDPEFCDPENGNFYLQESSCCIGAGEGGVDIGALGAGCQPCLYTPGDCDHNGVPLELGDVIAMIGMYRGTVPPYYVCDCPPHGAMFAATADPDGNCVALELGDVVTEIAAYRGTGTASGCEDCPGSRRIGYGDGYQPVIRPTLKFKTSLRPREH